MNTVIVLFQVFSQPVSQEWTQWLFYSRYLQSVSQEWTQWLFYSRYFHNQCPRNEHSDCSIPGIFTVSVPGMNTVIVLFHVFSQPVSQEWTQWLFYSRYFHSQCPRNEHSDCSIPGIFTASVPGVNTVIVLFQVSSVSVPGVYIVTVLFQVFSQSVSQEWTQWLFYSRYLHSQCPRSEHSDCSILGVFTASVPGVYTVTVLFQVFSQPVSQEWTQWLFYSRYHHSQCARSVHSEYSILGIFTVSVPGVNTVTVLFQVFLQSVSQECTQWLASSQSVSQECTQWLFYSRYFHSQCPRSEHSECSIPGIFHSQCRRNEHSDCSIPGIFTASVPGMNTVIVLFQVSSQPGSQEWTQWLFYSRYFHSQCPRSEHSDCSIPGIFTYSVPGVYIVTVLFQVFSQPVSQEWTQWLFYSRYFHSQCPRSEHSDCSIPGIFSQCPRNEHSDCSIPGIFTVSVPEMNTVIVLFQVSSQSVSQEWTQWLFYSRYFHSQCPRNEHSDCSIPGIFTASVPGVNTVIVLFQVSSVSVPGMNTVIVLFQVFSQPVSQEWTQWLFYSRYFHSQCPRSEHSDCSILGIFTVSIPGVNIVTVLFQASSQPVSQEWTQWLFYSGHLHSQCPRGEHSHRSIPGIFTASVTGVNTVIVLFQVFSQSVSQECTEW